MESLGSERDRPMLEEFGGKMEAEVLDRCKIEDSKRDAFKGRGAPLEWRRVRKNKKHRIRKWEEDRSESATCSDCRACRRSWRK